MYIIKNALRCIGRAKGRNVLIAIIVLVISLSACIGLSIRQAASSAKEETLKGMSVTGTISFDRKSLMENMTPPDMNGGFDRSQFGEKMSGNDLTLDDYQKYSKADSVSDFYYTTTVSVNETESFLAVTEDTESSFGGMGGFSGFGGMGGGKGDRFGASGDFTIVGYSADSAMTDFINGSATITDGVVFDEGTKNLDCIISEELATYNSIEVGNTVTVCNPNNEEEIYTLMVVGIYSDSTANQNEMPMMMGGSASDPANKIYTSYAALMSIVSRSEQNSTTVTDEDTGRQYETKLSNTLSATYVFEDVEAYNAFEDEVRELGLDDSYAVSSNDLTEYENSLVPLNTLSKMAGWFLVVILVIGAIILVVLNIFNVRERKYEIGVLTAMGMKKIKVAAQFLTEIFVVTLVSVTIGALIGAVTSVPVTNALLENQVASQNQKAENITQGFGRDPGQMMGQGGMGGFSQPPGDMGGGKNPFANMFGSDANANYVTSISSATNLTVIFQMLGIAILLTLVSGMASMLFVMRYEPLKILANRD